MAKKNIIPVFLCGGSGTRLWPMSRGSYPKQFLKYIGADNYSFLQETYKRVFKLKDLGDPIIICNSEHRFIVAEQMREINKNKNNILLEPFSKNTAPAVALAAFKAIEIDEDPLLLVLPADHFIKQVDHFTDSIEKCIQFANKGLIVTFGIEPSYPETGYGYIESEKNFEKLKEDESIPIKRFIEKPNIEKAKKLIQDKKFFWNSGIFLMKAKVALNQIKKFAPDIFLSCQESINSKRDDLDFQRIGEKSFEKCPNLSFDIAVMEKTELGTVFPLDVNWSDVGNWDSLWKISEKDRNGNVVDGNITLLDVKNSYLKSSGRLLVGLNVSDLIIVETFDAILVAQKGTSQRVKDLVEILKNKDIEEATTHKKIFRPWGNYESLANGDGWQVKRINVKKGTSLSLQKHNYRTEHWIIVSGLALVELENQKKILKKNESTYIPLGSKHRLSNIGEEELIIIEVQSGTYLGEDDIIRFEDNYGR